MSSFEEFFKLFERGVVALERLADAPQATHTLAPSPDIVVAEAITAAKRARKAKTTESAVTVVTQTDVVAEDKLLLPAAEVELDFEPPPPVATIDDMRTALRAYQQATDPKAAMALLQLHGKASTLSAVPENLRAAVVKAATEGAKAKL